MRKRRTRWSFAAFRHAFFHKVRLVCLHFQPGCACIGFSSSFACSCGNLFPDHETVFESREDREAAGRPVDNLAMGGEGYEAMGGITNYSSLVDGYAVLSWCLRRLL
jgi:hypothetical protein